MFSQRDRKETSEKIAQDAACEEGEWWIDSKGIVVCTDPHSLNTHAMRFIICKPGAWTMARNGDIVSIAPREPSKGRWPPIANWRVGSLNGMLGVFNMMPLVTRRAPLEKPLIGHILGQDLFLDVCNTSCEHGAGYVGGIGIVVKARAMEVWLMKDKDGIVVELKFKITKWS